MLLIVVGLLLTPLHIGGLIAVMVILAVFTNLTAIQRVWFVWRQSHRRGGPSEATSDAAEGQPSAGLAPEGSRQKEELEVRPGPEPAGG